MPESRDPLDSFKDLQGPTYPGSKKVRRSQQRAQPAEERDERRWDAHPVILTLEGKPTELFTVGQLGEALGGRRGGAIRKWEELGYLPPADYRFPGTGKHGQRRLYTREQVEGIARIAEEEGVLRGRKVSYTNFTERVLPLFGPNARKVSDPVGKVRP